jgi:hypothetical protein
MEKEGCKYLVTPENSTDFGSQNASTSPKAINLPLKYDVLQMRKQLC